MSCEQRWQVILRLHPEYDSRTAERLGAKQKPWKLLSLEQAELLQENQVPAWTMATPGVTLLLSWISSSSSSGDTSKYLKGPQQLVQSTLQILR